MESCNRFHFLIEMSNKSICSQATKRKECKGFSDCNWSKLAGALLPSCHPHKRSTAVYPKTCKEAAKRKACLLNDTCAWTKRSGESKANCHVRRSHKKRVNFASLAAYHPPPAGSPPSSSDHPVSARMSSSPSSSYHPPAPQNPQVSARMSSSPSSPYYDPFGETTASATRSDSSKRFSSHRTRKSPPRPKT